MRRKYVANYVESFSTIEIRYSAIYGIRCIVRQYFVDLDCFLIYFLNLCVVFKVILRF